ncbi:MAG: DNA mismatch repair endonuclease MutL [Defluviitaleaceae bacterium]|nr:DNA mismatch repair endonuclease MutL [Defluviitaleaceae bacterium]MCL2240166.1 DNA mismatch repair endonuclease MutL [Defluviitaleaceae bacterium]
MKPIIQLEQRLIDKIAAGEVVERPLSVVKELTENAIDAGAGVVTVEITDGGLTMIRVTDNGVGIRAEELPLAFARHATSKIAKAEDLFSVLTLGFRGEALSSIAAVSQVEMLTKPQGAVMGVRAEVHGGHFVSRQHIGCANGTTVIVSHLFYNVPARRKFLKKPATEAGYISDCLQKLALGNPGLCIRYISNGQRIFQTSGNGDLRTAMLNIYGRDVASKLIGVDAGVGDGEGPVRLYGLLGKPELARGNRSHGTFFINGRYVQSRLLSTAVEAAFKTLLPGGKFPLYVLYLTLPAQLLDVNVHPTKMDVRFAEEEAVREFVQGALAEALGGHILIPTARIARGSDEVKEREPMYYPMETAPAPAENLSVREREDPRTEGPRTESAPPPPVFTQLHRVAPSESPPFFHHYRMLGLLFNTYWLVAQGESLFLVDQHAAHERVLYEEILRSAASGEVHSQPLLSPIPLRLTPRESQTLRDNEAHFHRLGFGLRWDDTAELTAVPFLFKGPVASGFFMELLDKLDENAPGGDIYANKTELIAIAACKAAVKGGDALSEAEAHDLLKQLFEMKNPFTCPHGRPTIIEITRRELERRFKRA